MLKIDLKSLNKPKIIYITVTVLLITSIIFYVLKEKEKRLRIATQHQLTQTIEEKRLVKNKLTEIVLAKEQVEEELTSEKEKSSTLMKELTDKEQQIKITLDRLEQEITARKKAEAQLMIALKKKKNLEAKVSYLKEIPTIELEKIVIKPGPALTGKIITVNKKYAFVVINLGSQHNIEAGSVLSVYRNEEFIGKIQVEKVAKEMSAAAILSDWKNVEFKEKDTVKTI